jgi:hypothetical protein
VSSFEIRILLCDSINDRGELHRVAKSDKTAKKEALVDTLDVMVEQPTSLNALDVLSNLTKTERARSSNFDRTLARRFWTPFAFVRMR